MTHTRLNNNDDSNLSGDQPFSTGQQKQSFATAASSYFALLSSLDVRLRRQIYALGEAEILFGEASNKMIHSNLSAPLGPNRTGKGAATGGGLGNLDVGWLNSRNGHVGKKKDAELWEEAQRCVEKTEERRFDGI